jgi:hypothetical protein
MPSPLSSVCFASRLVFEHEIAGLVAVDPTLVITCATVLP